MSITQLMINATAGGALTVTTDTLIVAGGGGAGGYSHGGGGAGAMLDGQLELESGTTYSIQVGRGGATATHSPSPGVDSFFGPTANPARAYRGAQSASDVGGSTGAKARSGGSSTGYVFGYPSNGTNNNYEQLGLTYYGNRGGRTYNRNSRLAYGGGGGGAGGVGADAIISTGGNGGAGRAVSWITTTARSNLGVGVESGGSVYFAGGGAGMDRTGGVGGGGNSKGDATAHTGGGGGGYTLIDSTVTAGDGGTGVVVLRLNISGYNPTNDFTNTSGLSVAYYDDGTYTYIAFKCTSAANGGSTGTGTWTPNF